MSERVSSPSSRVAPKFGVVVVEELVRKVVSSDFLPGDVLPPEAELCKEFGVSRSVIRESIKRIQEKGLLVVAQGRRTTIAEPRQWNMLDPIVLGSLIDHDMTLGVLDEITVVRSSLEASMSGEVAADHTKAEIRRLQGVLDRMQTHVNQREEFDRDDAEFHYLIMDFSGNRLATNVARTLYDQALKSPRYRGNVPQTALADGYQEMMDIFDAIRASDRHNAEEAMRYHIMEGWRRRKLPSEAGRSRRRMKEGTT
jgi:DNA-binding FadR family transcriptional regulator